MDDDHAALGIRNWELYEQQFKGRLGLQLMSSMVECGDTKSLQSNGGLFYRDCAIPEPSVPMDFVRDGWVHQNRDNEKILNILPMNLHDFPAFDDVPHDQPQTPNMLQIIEHLEPTEDEKAPIMGEPITRNEVSSKNRPQEHKCKSPKPRKPKKVVAPKGASTKRSVSHGKAGVKESTSIVINGIDFGISGIPTPVCSCTGKLQQCYRWGAGGWQSACCTTSISMYPLPMSTKRRGARITGRKMSQGAFKKVLEKHVGEGYSLSNPIDLRPFWAKHGTNKFVTIR